MGLGVVVPAEALEAAESVVGARFERRPRPTVGGYSNLSFFADCNGETLVIKAASIPVKRADLRREARVLGLLAMPSDTEIAVPSVFAHADSGDWTVTALRFIEGEYGPTALEQRPRSSGKTWATLLARLMQAVLRATPQPVGDVDLDLPTRYRALHAVVDTMPDELRAQMHRALDSPVVDRGVSFVHGDFGLHNILWHTQLSRVRVGALLDWEFSGWGCPLTDVAWFWWTLQFRNLHAKLWPPFVEAFGPWALTSAGFEEESVLALIRVQMILLVARTPSGSAARDEWLRRWAALDDMPQPSLS